MKVSIKRLLLILSVILVGLSACGQKEGTPESTPEIQPTETSLPSIAPTPIAESTPASEEYTRYQFEMTLDYSRHTAQVIQTIDYLNKSAFSLPSLLLVVPPRAFPNAYQQIELNGDTILSFSEDGIRTTIQLLTPLEPGQHTTLRLAYDLVIPQRESSFGWTPRQTNLSNWYPYIAPLSSDQTWISHDPLIDPENKMVGEYIVNEIADFELTLRLAENLPNLLVVSGANAEAVAEGMRYYLKQARALSFSISNQFYHEQLEHNGLKINAYVFQYQKDSAAAMLQIASQAMDLFTEIYGPYHLPQVSLVSADFLHNMEMDGMVLISSKVIDFYDDTPKNNLTILVPHELAHQWFYSQVGNNHALEPWLDEALATYSEVLFYEHYYPDLDQWWWDNRVYAHPHSGFVDNSIYDAGTYDNYRASVYLHGAIFLHDLRITMGDGAFMSALKSYIDQNNMGIAGKNDFLAVFQAANPDADIQAVFARYFME